MEEQNRAIEKSWRRWRKKTGGGWAEQAHAHQKRAGGCVEGGKLRKEREGILKMKTKV